MGAVACGASAPLARAENGKYPEGDKNKTKQVNKGMTCFCDNYPTGSACVQMITCASVGARLRCQTAQEDKCESTQPLSVVNPDGFVVLTRK